MVWLIPRSHPEPGAALCDNDLPATLSNPPMNSTTLSIVAGVLQRNDGRVLVSTRPPGRAMAGAWEFPGGKRESGEGRWEALHRELAEELDIRITDGRPLIQTAYAYPDGPSVHLDVWLIHEWNGVARPREGQAIAWHPPEDLEGLEMLAANRPIVTALCLPPRYLVTPEPRTDLDAFLEELDVTLGGARELLVQLRGDWLAGPGAAATAHAAVDLGHRHGRRVLVNGDADLAQAVGADGVHLPARQARELDERPLPPSCLVGVSCHDLAELRQAEALGANFVTLGHVRDTPSHPGKAPLGWQRFGELAGQARLPLYAIGGMREDDLEALWRHGAQGYAAISSLWRKTPQEG